MKTLFRGLKAVALGAALGAALIGVTVIVLKAIERWPVWVTTALLLFASAGLSWLVGDYLEGEDGE